MSIRTVSYLLMSISLIAVTAGATIYGVTGVDHFQEEGFITTLSVLYLLLIAVLAFLIFRIRNQTTKELPLWKNPAVIWLLITAGLIFLAADEYYEIHENLDFLIHDFFNMEETNLTDHIDDFLVMVYAFLGLGALVVYRNELKLFQEVWPYFVIGFVLAFIMIIVDALTNGADLLMAFINREPGDPIEAWIKMIEDIAKIFSQTCFVIAFYAILVKARAIHQPLTPPNNTYQTDIR